MTDHRRQKYTTVSLEPQALASLHLARAWLTGQRGQTATLSDTVVQLVEWYAEARAEQARAAEPEINPWTDRATRAVHTKEKPHTEEDCDVCNYNEQLRKREEG